MSWVNEVLERYKQPGLRFRPYKPLDRTRDRWNPEKIEVERSPFDPSSFYQSLNYVEEGNRAATAVTRQQAANQLRLEQQRAIDLSQGQINYSQLPSQGLGKAGSGKPGQSGLSRPLVNYSVSSGYGPRTSPTSGRAGYHSGIDLAAPQGTPIYATHDGYVTQAGYNGGYGNYVYLNGSGIATSYAHQAQIAVKSGQYVRRGQVIGYVGSTGDSTGPHLHYEVYVNGQHVNPVGYL